jgi:DNA-binding transcriptional ArsR family regulator
VRIGRGARRFNVAARIRKRQRGGEYGRSGTKVGAKRSEMRIITDGGYDHTNHLADHDKRLSQLNTITQTTRANLVQNVIGHRWMMPSKKELDYYNQSKSPGTITGHLDKLVESDILIRLIMPPGERRRDGPGVFFSLSDEGYALLAHHAIFLPELEEIREDHRRVEKTDEICRYEGSNRPTINVEYAHPLQGDGRSVVDPEEYAEEAENDSCEQDSDNNDKKRVIGDSL